MRTDSPLLKYYYKKLPKYQETGQVTPDQKRLQELGSDAYTAMQPFYNTVFEAGNKYANPKTGITSPFNSLRATMKGLIKHPEVIFMKRHNIPSNLTDENHNPYGVEGYRTPLSTGTRPWYPTQWAEPRKEHTGLQDWFERMRMQHEENKAERQGRRNRGKTGCWGANCYEELDEAKFGGLHKYQTKGKVINSPIYTDDPKKVKAYNDSLNLYNQGESFKNLFQKYIDEHNYFANQLSNPNRTQRNIPIPKINAFDLMQPLNNPNIKPIKTQYVLGQGALGNSLGDPNYQFTENINQKSHVYNDPSMKVGHVSVNDGRYNLMVGVNKHIPALRTYKKPVQPFVYKKSTPPPPSLSPGVKHVDTIHTDINTSIPNIITRSTPNVQLPSKVDMGKYKVDYFDPSEGTDTNGGWHTKSFMTEQESQDYMKSRPMYGPNMTQRVEYKLGGLHKYQVDGTVTDCPQGFSKNALGMCVNAAGQTPEQATGAKNILQSVTKKTEVNTKPLATPYVTREQQVTAAVKNAEKENKPGLYNQSFVGPMQFKTIDDERARAEKLQQYVNEHPYAQLNSQGNLERTNWDRDMETGQADKGTPAAKLDRGADALMTGIDAAGMITGAGEIAKLGKLGYNAIKKGLIESTESGLLSKASKVNPFAGTFEGESKLPNFLQFNKLDDPEAYWRLTKDAEKYGLGKGAYFNKGVPLTGELAETFPKGSKPWMHRYSGPKWNPETGKIDLYDGPDYLFKVGDEKFMEPHLDFPNSHLKFFRQSQNIPEGSSTLYKKNWLQGWKEVPSENSGFINDTKRYFTKPANEATFSPNYQNINKAASGDYDPFGETMSFGDWEEGPRVLDWNKIGKIAAGVGAGIGVGAGAALMSDNKKIGGLHKYQKKGTVTENTTGSFGLPPLKFIPQKSDNTAVYHNYTVPIVSPIEDYPEDRYVSQVTKSDEFLKNWYKGRSSDPRYTNIAKNRIAEISKIQEVPVSKKHLDSMSANGYYNPGTKNIYINPNDYHSRKASTQTHEKTHELYDQVPQPNQDDIIKSIIVPEKKWVTPRPDLDPKEYGYSYFSDPTEIAARLNVFRRRFGLDPKHKYSAKEMQKIMFMHMNIKNDADNSSDKWEVNEQSGGSNINELFNIIGNDPAKLAELNDKIVMNEPSIKSNVAKNGGLTKYQYAGPVQNVSESTNMNNNKNVDLSEKLNKVNANLKEENKISDDFLKNWYSQRTDDPRYGKVAQERINELPNINIVGTSQSDLNKKEALAYYNTNILFPNNWYKDIHVNKYNPSSANSSTLTHEKTHELDYNVPQNNQDDIVKNLVVPQDKFTGNGDYKYFSTPTEVTARLNQFRKSFKLDPNKKYTAGDIQKLINDNYGNPFMNMQSFQELYDILGNDASKLAQLNDQIVMNQSSDNMTVAKLGGMTKYKKGGEYDMSHDDIQKLIKQGYKIQFV